MRNVILLFFLFSIKWLSAQNIESKEKERNNNVTQINILIKGTAYFLGLYAGADIGFEKRISKKWTGMISYTHFSNIGEGEYNSSKNLIALQSRYYLTKNILKSPYVGVLLQKYIQIENYYFIGSSNPLEYVRTKNSNLGTGLILGTHVNLKRRFGIDIHSGISSQFGSKDETIRYKNAPNGFETERYTFKPRFFWGFNFYYDLSRYKKKNTEG